MAQQLGLDSLAEALAAGVGGVVCTTVLYPLEIVKNKLQVPTFFSIGRDLWQQHGLKGMYWGNTESNLWGFVEKFFYFFAYFGMRRLIEFLRGTQRIGTGWSLVVGYLSEWVHLPFTMPLEVWTVRVQCSPVGKPHLETLFDVYANGGIGSFYRSASAFIFLAFKPALKYSAYELMRGLVLARRGIQGGNPLLGTLRPLEGFVLGGVARCVTEILLYPYTRAKMVIVGKEGRSVSRGLIGALHANLLLPSIKIYILLRDEGVRSIYQGLGPQLFRGVLSSAIMLACKEQMFSTFRRGLMFSLRR